MKRISISLYFCFCIAFICFSQEKKVRLLFAGDAMQHKSQIDAARTKNGFDYSNYYKHIKEEIDSADIAVVNLEVALGGSPYTGYPCFSAPDEFAYELKDSGFDIFLTANNHCLDKGKKGLERTISILDTMQVKHLGTYVDQDQRKLRYPLMIIKNGIRIAMLNYTYGTNGLEVQAPNVVNYIDKKVILKDIEAAKNMNPDIIVANMHWGYEYKLIQHKEQTDMGNFLVANGVNLVIGGHPHVVQPIDIRQEGDSIKQVVVYSMGNFISGMKAVNTDGGMMVNIEISKDGDNPVKIDNCTYSLVFVHKPIVNGKTQFQLIPVDKYENKEDGLSLLGTAAYNRMINFAKTARKTVESMWKKPINTENIK